MAVFFLIFYERYSIAFKLLPSWLIGGSGGFKGLLGIDFFMDNRPDIVQGLMLQAISSQKRLYLTLSDFGISDVGDEQIADGLIFYLDFYEQRLLLIVRRRYLEQVLSVGQR
jgi:hypothetical protein